MDAKRAAIEDRSRYRRALQTIVKLGDFPRENEIADHVAIEEIIETAKKTLKPWEYDEETTCHEQGPASE